MKAFGSGARPMGAYDLVSRDGDRLYVSGLGPFNAHGDAFTCVGRLGLEVSIEEGQAAARTTAARVVEALSAFVDTDGAQLTLHRVRGYLACDSAFDDHVAVMDAASAAFLDLLGVNGRHSRTTVGVCSLPFNIPIVLEVDASLRRGAAA